MRDQRFLVRKAAVLGAGVMGAQIAAHLTNANVETILFELPAKEGDPNGNVLSVLRSDAAPNAVVTVLRDDGASSPRSKCSSA